MIKRFIILVLCFAMLFSLVACNGGGEDVSGTPDENGGVTDNTDNTDNGNGNMRSHTGCLKHKQQNAYHQQNRCKDNIFFHNNST